MRRFLLHLILYLCPLLSLAHDSKTEGRTLEFIKNEGQWKEPFLYKANTGSSDIYLENNGFTYVIGAADNFERIHYVKHNNSGNGEILKYHAYKVSFVDGHSQQITGSKPQKHYYNYFLGNDQSKWRSSIHPVLAVDYAAVYKGIDAHIASADGQMKYDFMVQPGADPDQIRLRFDGTDGISIKDKKLQIKTSVGTVEELAPYAYQYIDGARVEVPCRYKVSGSDVRFLFPEGYDESAVLIIDPTVVFATFTGSTVDNWGFTATYDESGNFYGGGIVAGLGFPTSTGAFQVSFGGPFGSLIPGDIAVIKYDPTGTSMIWASYLGGSDLDQPHSMVVDANNNLVVAGRSFSSDFPVLATSFDNTHNGQADIIVTKFNATGTALIGSTFVGGSGNEGVNVFSDETTFGSLKYNYGDDARSEVILDKNARVYVTAATNSTDFPLANASQPSLAGSQDAVVFRLSPNLNTLEWSTYLGGSEDDAGYVLALDTAQTSIFVGGGTRSNNFPYTAGTYQSSYQGGDADGYIAKFNTNGSFNLQGLTSIATSNYDQVYGVQVDEENNVYAMGQSLGGQFPVSPGVYSNPSSSQFVIKVNNSLSTKIFSTVFGSGDPNTTNISPVAFLVDNCENIYISGWGGNLGIPSMNPTIGTTNGMAVTAAQIPAGGLMKATTDGADFYFIVFQTDATALLYAAFYGRTSNTAFFGEHVDGGTSRFDKAGVIYQAICGGCGGSSGPALPTTSGSFSPTNGSSNCNLASLKVAFEFTGVIANAITNSDTSGCAPLTVQFSNLSTNATSFIWDYGDGSSTNATNPNPQHTYTNAGTYIAKLIVANPQSCSNPTDTDYVTIVVDSGSVDASFTHVVTDSCGPYRVSLTNTSNGNAPTATYVWNFGDGNTFTGANPGTHDYSGPGDYTITLIANDPAADCSPVDSMKVTVSMLGYVNSKFNVDDTSVCVNQPVVLGNASGNATNVVFYFSNGDTLTGASPVYLFTLPGTYIITLVAYNPKSCNKTDTATQTVTVYDIPNANFTYAPAVPVPNEPISFTNLSTGAILNRWNFGDGKSSNEVNPVHLFNRTRQFLVCLEVENERGCIDTLCKYVDAIIHPALDVPTGFTPNGDGNNDVLYVRGAAVATVDFKVYNRWGQMVFESTSMDKGWDGIYNGKPQEMEAYGWTISATFLDGSSASKSGNVTLMR